MKSTYLNTLPFLRITLPFILGIFAGYYFSNTYMPVVYGLLVILVLFVILLLGMFTKAFSDQLIFTPVLFLFLFVYGVLLFSHHEKEHLVYPEFGRQVLVAKVLDTKEISENTSILKIQSISLKSDDKSFKASLFLNKGNEPVMPGAEVVCQVNLEPLKNKGNPGEFDFASWLKRQHITANGFITSYSVVNTQKNYAWYVWHIKERLKKIYIRAGIDPQNAALLFALTSGDKSLITKDQRQAFADSGLIHILAVSGLHVGIVYLMLFTLIKPLSKRPKGKVIGFTVVAMVLFGYALFTGLSPSVTRAVIMFVLIDLGRLIKKSHLIYNIILVSAFIVLLIDPHYLFEPGFWLSYGAVLSILLIMNLVSPFIREKPFILKKFYEITLVSLAAQPGTFPLVLFWFKQFPKYFLVTNILVIPVIGIALIYNFIVIGLGFIGVPLTFIAKPLNWLITYINFIPQWISGLNTSVFNAITINFAAVALLYFIMGFVLFMIYTKNLRLLKVIGLLAIVFIIQSGFTSFKNQNKTEVVVFNTKQFLLAERQGIRCTVYANDTLNLEPCILDYQNTSGIKQSEIRATKDWLFAGGDVFQFINNQNEKMLGLTFNRYLLLSTFPVHMDEALPFIKSCVILNACNHYNRSKIVDWCKKNNVPYFDIKQEGAFVINKKIK